MEKESSKIILEGIELFYVNYIIKDISKQFNVSKTEARKLFFDSLSFNTVTSELYLQIACILEQSSKEGDK